MHYRSSDKKDKLIKSNVKKIWVFNACRKAGCESVSLMSVGRLFQTSGPLTENARRPNCVLVRRTTADLVVDDRSWRWCALGLNATRSLRPPVDHDKSLFFMTPVHHTVTATYTAAHRCGREWVSEWVVFKARIPRHRLALYTPTSLRPTRTISWSYSCGKLNGIEASFTLLMHTLR